jgi:hypothetical protein
MIRKLGRVPGTRKLAGFEVTPTGEWIPVMRRAKHSPPSEGWNRAAKRKFIKEQLKKEGR